MADNILTPEQTEIILDKSNESLLAELGIDPKRTKKIVPKSKENRGGARAGAGRPKVEGLEPKIRLSLYVSQQTRDTYMQLRDLGISPTKVFEDAIANMAKMLNL